MLLNPLRSVTNTMRPRAGPGEEAPPGVGDADGAVGVGEFTAPEMMGVMVADGRGDGELGGRVAIPTTRGLLSGGGKMTGRLYRNTIRKQTPNAMVTKIIITPMDNPTGTDGCSFIPCLS